MGLDEENSLRDRSSAPPRWDLRGLFPARDSAALSDAFAGLEQASDIFLQKYRGNVARLSGADLGRAVAEYEKITETAARIGAYAFLTRSVDQSEAVWAEKISERLRRSTSLTVFFPIEISQMREADLLSKVAAPELSAYSQWIGAVRNARAHSLSQEEEAFLMKKKQVGETALVRLFTQTINDLRVHLMGTEVTVTEALHIIRNADDQRLRQETFSAFGQALATEKKIFSTIFNTLAGLKSSEDQRRKFDTPEGSRHFVNQVPGEMAEAMLRATQGEAARLAHRYYAWKAQKFGVARLHPADCNAPLPGEKNRIVSWDEAKEIILASCRGISPEIEAAGKRFFDEGWIDAEPRAGKRMGAFAHRAVPSDHPYVMMNFFGTPADTQVLAHEIGHGIHQLFSAGQGHLKSPVNPILAEASSVFGEMIVFGDILERETDPLARRALLSGKIESMLNTVVRQTAFFNFEKRAHEEYREKGELPAARLSALWRETQKQSLGASVNLDVAGAEHQWMYIAPFVQAPFSSYGYAMGHCIGLALYDAYLKAPDRKAFGDRYIDFLKSGSGASCESVLQSFGFDPATETVWRKGLGIIGRHIDDLARLDKQITPSIAKPDVRRGAAGPA